MKLLFIILSSWYIRVSDDMTKLTIQNHHGNIVIEYSMPTVLNQSEDLFNDLDYYDDFECKNLFEAITITNKIKKRCQKM